MGFGAFHVAAHMELTTISQPHLLLSKNTSKLNIVKHLETQYCKIRIGLQTSGYDLTALPLVTN